MSTRYRFSEQNRSFLPLTFTSLLLGISGIAHASHESFHTLQDVLSSREFVDGCIGSGGGTVLLSVDPTYGEEATRLAVALRDRYEAMNIADEIDLYAARDWNAEARCKGPWLPGPRAVVYVMPFKDDSGGFHSARIVVHSNQRCSEGFSERGRYPSRCNVTKDLQRHGVIPRIRLPALPSAKQDTLGLVPADQPPRQHRQSRARANGLLAAATVMAGTTLTFRTLHFHDKLINRDDFGGHMWDGLAWTSSLGVAALGASAGASWPDLPQHRLRRVARLGLGGGASICAGIAIIIAARMFMVQSEADPTIHSTARTLALSGFHAIGELAVGVGMGLVSVSLRQRFTLRPNLAGLTVSGKF